MPLADENGNPVYNEDGTRKARPHYIYTMKQAIEEKFILDVLKYYTPYQSYYHIIKTVEDDPLFDKNVHRAASSTSLKQTNMLFKKRQIL